MSLATNSEQTRRLATQATLSRSGRSRMGVLRGIEIVATGSYVPETIVHNHDLEALGCDSDWIVQRTGILQRRKAAEGQASSDLALLAAEQCLQRAGVSPAEVDLIVLATITPDQPTPSTACHLQRMLGCIAPAMDVSAACAGFMYALVTAGQFVANGSSQCALVVGAEVMSRTINPRDVKTYPLFGDGAGALLLKPTENRDKGLISYTLGSEGSGAPVLCIPGGGSRSPLTTNGLASGEQFLQMEGLSVFRWAVRVIAESAQDCLAHSNSRIDEVDWVILHQANIRIIESAMRDFSLPADKVLVNLERYGNTSAASIPLVLDEAICSGKIRAGDRLLLNGFGAGLAWGTAIMQL